MNTKLFFFVFSKFGKLGTVFLPLKIIKNIIINKNVLITTTTTTNNNNNNYYYYLLLLVLNNLYNYLINDYY